LPAASVRAALPRIRKHVPASWVTPETAQLLKALFEQGAEGFPVFQQLLKARGDQVHFLDFWRAFSKAAHLLTSLLCDGLAQDEGLAMELETVRDGILRHLEAPESPDGGQSISVSELAGALRGAAAMSRAPEFWAEAEAGLRARADQEKFSLEDLGQIMIAWLQDAIVWQIRLVDSTSSRTPSKESAASGADKRPPGTPVFVHIYDVSQEDGVRKLNKVLAHRYSPLKFGGVFHAGVEVNGLEWSYGMSQSDTLPGLSCVLPKTHPNHRYRQSVELKQSRFSPEDIAELISAMAEEYPGHDYHLLRRNCCHFADDFCRRIGAGGIPGWVHRLARVGANLDTVMHKVMNRRLLDEESDSD